MKTPENIPLVIGSATEWQKKALRTCIDDPTNLHTCLPALGNHWPVKIGFKEPVIIERIKRWVTIKETDGYRSRKCVHTAEGTEHVFKGFFAKGDRIFYTMKSNSRTGYLLPPLSLIEGYEILVDNKNTKEFKSLEEFKRKFDPRFISEELISTLYKEKSAQTGARYNKSDFKSISKVGKEVLNRFLSQFTDINCTDKTHYQSSTFDDKTYYSLSKKHYSNGTGGCGRDINISHTFGIDRVHYSSEYPGCGNGTYGILANKHQYLWLEND